MISVRNVGKNYEGELVRALRGVSVEISRGEIVSVMGPSGSGKSTLLNLIGTLDAPTSGEVLIEGRSVTASGPLPAFRARNIGFVFQFHHLVETMTLEENVEAPLVPLGTGKRERREIAARMLVNLGLEGRRGFFPSKVSGGERQRAAIARALVNDPKIVLADEPTGQLDAETGRAAAGFLINRCREMGITLVMVTHNPEIARMAERMISIRDGAVTGDEILRTKGEKI